MILRNETCTHNRKRFNKIVRESICSILSEADWQTNINAGRKRLDQSKTNNNGKTRLLKRKSDDLYDYGYDKFAKHYGIHDYAPEDPEEAERNIEDAALDYMLFANSYDEDGNDIETGEDLGPDIGRVYDPFTKVFARMPLSLYLRGGIAILMQR